MKPIPAEVVERTWKRVASRSVRGISQLVRRMSKRQPYVLQYLLAVGHDILNQDERELLIYLGVVVWQIMSQGSKSLPVVSGDMLDEAERRNLQELDYLGGETITDPVDLTRKMIGGYGQSEVLRHVVEALMEEPEEDCLIRDELKGIIMLDLKNVIDCFDR